MPRPSSSSIINKHRLTKGHLAILKAVCAGDTNNPMRVNDLAHITGITRPTVGRLVNDLHHIGMMMSVRLEEDRRLTRLLPTLKGHAVAKEAKEAV
jgi:DNA-binding MarR family transcriptional regulator